ncbi:3380_t:CDS:2 [Funneliformis mosseae]|uniref:3380_t:CDS:1 n=1 Tax=Funneliformis mosseae TaxID=27381 RepID=A0A9N8VV18_FUNMO|nr:3380_t:CDS:2 [Funneliformis mosseae]
MFFLPTPTSSTLRSLAITYGIITTLLLTVEIIQRTYKIPVHVSHPLEGATLGTVYFAFSTAFLFGWFHEGWENGFPCGRAYLAIAGLMAMTFGDAFASIIGKTYGARKYRVIGDSRGRKTIEGSLANFIATLISVFVFWWIMTPPAFSTWDYFTGALVAAITSTCFEAISPMGSDNITVPLGVAFTLSFLGY